VGASKTEGLVGVAMHDFHEKAVKSNLRFTSSLGFATGRS
jgi:hypothetical protein